MAKMADRRMSGGIPPEALGTPLPDAKPSRMAQRRIARGELVELPVYGQVWLEVLGARQLEEIEAAVFKHMAELGLPPVTLHANSYNMQRFARVMHESARDPDDPTHAARFGTLSEWQDETENVLVACIRIWSGVKARLDPLDDPKITDDDSSQITEALKKKDIASLRSFDTDTLIAYLLSGASQPASSPQAASTNGDSSLE